MKKILLTLMALVSALMGYAQSQEWIDITDIYVVNPRFDGDDVKTGWSGTAFGAANPVGNAEHYNKVYDSYQTISGLSSGKYRVSLSAFYRAGSSAQDYEYYTSGDYSDHQLAVLYAASAKEESTALLPLASSAALETSLGGGTSTVGTATGGNWWESKRLYIPNNMQAAHYWFEAGYYRTSCEVSVGTDGQLTIGIRKKKTQNGDWTCLDNWKLEYYGGTVMVTSITIPSTLEVELGSSTQIVPTYKPSNALFKKASWTSSDESVATVDDQGTVTTHHAGQTVITATTVDGSNLSSECLLTVTFNGAKAGQVVFNEVMSANVDMFVDPSWNYGGFVELYNPTYKDVSIGTYWLSDDSQNLRMARIPISVGKVPARGFRVLWFDHKETRKDIGENWENTQIDMKLDCDGDTIFLSDDAGNIIASQVYPQAVMRASYARTKDGDSTWGYTAMPTPGESNTQSSFATEQLTAPEVDQPGQLFYSPLEVNVTIPSGTTLRYTTDGSTPTLDNGETSTDGYFPVEQTSTLRFRLFRDGYLPSDVVTRTYVYMDKEYYMPVVSIVTDPRNLYDNTIGIYVSGTNGKTANQDYTKRNFNMEWDRPASMEFFNDELNQDGYFAQEVDICISGGWSRKYEPRSFKLKSGKVYSLKNSLDYRFFPDKPYNKNKSLLLRNGGNDEYNQSRLKDIALQQIARVSQFPLNLQSHRSVHVFLNGKYHGMLNMREPSNKHYGYANYGIDTDDMDAFEMSTDSGYVQKEGTKEAFRRWYSLAENAQDPIAWQQLLDLVDIDDYTNYMAFKFYLNDWDWPHNNVKAFRQHSDGKFHMVVFDLDNCVDRTGNNIFNDFQNRRIFTFFGRPEYGGTSITEEVELVTIFLNMIKNEEFRRRFIDTYCVVGGSVFGNEEEIEQVVNDLAANIAPAIQWENHSPYGTGRSKAQGIINALTGNFRQTMTNMMRNYKTFGLSDSEPVYATLQSEIEGASLTVNGINIPRSRFDGYLFSPIRLKATAPAGYKFEAWRGTASRDAVSESRVPLFGMQSRWKFYDQGSLDGVSWQSADYSDASWSEGQALFGYHSREDGANINTTLDYGGNASNKRPTYYFRKTFQLDDEPTNDTQFQFVVNYDDGYVIYVNGTPVANERVPMGCTYNTYASAYGSDPYDTKTITLGADAFVKGENTVAVEIHNQSATSSDVYFDCSLTCILPADDGGESDFVNTNAEFTLPANTLVCDLVASFTPLSKNEMQSQNVTPIRINEVSAGNTVNVNDYYKKDDWIELYNTTDEDIDIAGMYLTDKKSNPHKYQISPLDDPEATVIPAFGYKVVWCSKRSETGKEIHANFKLDNNDGKMVRIEAADGAWADSLFYCAHEGNQTVGRYPDGSNEVYLMTKPTILASNQLTSYASPWEYVPSEDDPTDVHSIMAGTTDNMTLSIESDRLVVRAETATAATLRIYTAAGAQVAYRPLAIASGEERISIANLPTGIYVAHLISANGTKCTLKFTKK